MRRRIAAAALVVAALVPATARPGAPTPGDLLSGSAKALNGQKGVHYALDATIAATATAGANAQLEALAARPVTFTAEGDLDGKSLTAHVGVQGAGRPLSVKVLLGQNALYLNLGSGWYGSKSLGAKSIVKAGSRSGAGGVLGSVDTPPELAQSFDELFTGTVTDGPTVDGVPTWQFAGTLDPAGIAKLSAASKKPLTAKQLTAVTALAKSSSVTVAVGKDDQLVRHASLVLHLTPDVLAQLQASSTGANTGGTLTVGSLKGLQTLDVTLGADFSKWGEHVTFTPPAASKPLDQLLGLLLGGTLTPKTS